jgi:hypothetical protein
LNFLFLIKEKSFSFLGPYGYRAPGSDYGDHIRRVNGAWGADSGDDASETSSICSERSLEVNFLILKT